MSELERVQNQTTDEWLHEYDGYDKMGADELRAELRRVIAEEEKKRTKPQNNSLHLWLSQVAIILNEAGIDQILFLETLSGKAEIPNTTISLKERFWKPILKALTGKESTTDMDTKDPDAIYQTACRVLSTNFGIAPPAWPDKFREDER